MDSSTNKIMPTEAFSQICALETRIQELRASQISELKEKLREAKLTVAALEAEYSELAGQAPSSTPKSRTRTRTNSEDIRQGVLKALADAPTGMSQKEIADATGFKYQTVVLFLKNNLNDFKITGALKGKRYFLK